MSTLYLITAYIVHQYFVDRNTSNLGEKDWLKIQQLSSLYHELVLEQAALFDDTGKIKSQHVMKIKELNFKIDTLVTTD